MNYTQRFLKGSSAIFVNYILAAFCSYLIRILLAKYLSLEEFGLFYSIFTFIFFFDIFRVLGLDSAVIKFVAESRIKKELGKAKAIFVYSLSTRLCISIVIAVVLLALSSWLARVYFKNPQAQYLIPLFSIFFVLLVFEGVLREVFLAYGKPFLYALTPLLKNIFVVFFLLFFFVKEKGNLSMVILTYLLSTLLLIVIAGYIFFRIFPFFKLKAEYSKALYKRVLFYGLPLIFAQVGSRVISDFDTLMLTYFVPLKEVGVYNIILPTSMLFLYFANAIGTMILPLSSELWAQNKKENLERGIAFAVRYIYLLFIPLTLLMFSAGPYLINLFFPPEVVELGSTAFFILLVGVVFFTITNFLSGILAGIGNTKAVAVILLSSAGLNIILNYFLIPKFSLVGAASATAVSYLFSFFLAGFFIKRQLTFHFSLSLFSKILLLSLPYLILPYVLLSFFESDLLALLVGTLFSSLLYIPLLFLLKLVTRKEFNLVRLLR